MIFISHRGNRIGPNPELENTVPYIDEAIADGFDVEVDVWYYDNKFYLGHDTPNVEVSINYLTNRKIWCHAKSIQTLAKLLTTNAHCFWHQNDDTTLTSDRYMWTYPGKELTKQSIAVMPINDGWLKCAGVCSDYVTNLRDKHKGQI